jgi:phosphodiesterase/alkaline phosphatase D-like protein
VFPTDRFRIYKRIPLGKTADLFLLDERQYRTVDDGGQPAKILGDEQMNWLVAGLRDSTATWKIIANQVVIAPIDYGKGEPTLSDNWGGYGDSRLRLLSAIEQMGIPNVVFYTGDAHVFMVNLLASDPEGFRNDPEMRATGIEYVAGSISSPGTDRPEQQVRDLNPWNRQYNALAHGYAHLDVDASRLVTEYRRSDLLSPTGATYPFERFVQDVGTNQMARETVPPPAV